MLASLRTPAWMWQNRLGGVGGGEAADAATWLSLPQPRGGVGVGNKLEELKSPL